MTPVPASTSRDPKPPTLPQVPSALPRAGICLWKRLGGSSLPRRAAGAPGEQVPCAAAFVGCGTSGARHKAAFVRLGKAAPEPSACSGQLRGEGEGKGKRPEGIHLHWRRNLSLSSGVPHLAVLTLQSPRGVLCIPFPMGIRHPSLAALSSSGELLLAVLNNKIKSFRFSLTLEQALSPPGWQRSSSRDVSLRDYQIS